MLYTKLFSDLRTTYTDAAINPFCSEAALFLQTQLTVLNKIFQLYEIIDTPILLTTVTGKILHANTSFLEIFEYPSTDSIFSKPWQETIPEVSHTAITIKTILPEGLQEEITVLTIRPMEIQRRAREEHLQIFTHDYQNSLNTLIGIASYCLSVSRTSPEDQEKFSLLLRLAAEKAARQLKSFKTISLLETGTLEALFNETDIIPHLQQLIETYAIMHADHHISIQVTEMPTALSLNTNITLLEQVFENVLKNACEAAPRQSSVSVAITVLPKAIRIAIHNGSYIQPEHQQRLFKERFSSKDAQQRGFGTRSIKLLTEQYLCGEVGFTSAPETGTTFTVILPHITEPRQ